MKQTHTQTEGCGYRERRAWTSVLVILLSFSLEHLTSGGAGWLSHRAGELQVLRQEVCRIGATKAWRKIKVSLAWHKAGFNNAQHHLPLKQMQTVCLKVTSIPMAVQGLVRSVFCRRTWSSLLTGSWSQQMGQWQSFPWSIYVARFGTGWQQEWVVKARSSDTWLPGMCVSGGVAAARNIAWRVALDATFEGCCFPLVVDFITTASQLWMMRKMKS